MLKDFMINAKGLTKNPLGIIALFISLIYGFACLVLSTGLDNMFGPYERLPLIWFVIIFPILILGGFIYLVVTNHQKLYAPSDYQDEKNFFNAYQNNKSIPSENQANDELANNDPAIGGLILDYGSIKGLFGLYAVYLALTTKVTFTLESLENTSELLSKDYTQAFLVATLAVGIFDADTSEDDVWTVLDMDPIVMEKIRDNVYESAHKSKQETGTTYLLDQLNILERGFASVSKIPKPNHEKQVPDKNQKDLNDVEEVEVVE